MCCLNASNLMQVRLQNLHNNIRGVIIYSEKVYRTPTLTLTVGDNSSFVSRPFSAVYKTPDYHNNSHLWPFNTKEKHRHCHHSRR